MEKEVLGHQFLIEFYNCDSEKINDVEYIESSMLTAIKASNATIITHYFHKFNPHGVSGVVIIAESHVSIHSWPEYDYAAVDIFTCGDSINPDVISDQLKDALKSTNMSSTEVKRGMVDIKDGQKLLFKPPLNNRGL